MDFRGRTTPSILVMRFFMDASTESIHATPRFMEETLDSIDAMRLFMDDSFRFIHAT